MKRGLWLCLGLAAMFAASLVVADDKEKKHEHGAGTGALADAKCPVSGAAVSKDASISYKGGKLYFCCGGCPAKFEENLEKYASKANLQLVVTGQVRQVSCPVAGGKLNPETKMKVCGVDVCFCCNGCKGKVAKAAPEKQREMVFGKTFDKAFRAKTEKQPDKAS